MDKDLIEDKLCELIDQLHVRKIIDTVFCLALLDHAHSFYDGNRGTFKVLFVTDFSELL